MRKCCWSRSRIRITAGLVFAMWVVGGCLQDCLATPWWRLLHPRFAPRGRPHQYLVIPVGRLQHCLTAPSPRARQMGLPSVCASAVHAVKCIRHAWPLPSEYFPSLGQLHVSMRACLPAIGSVGHCARQEGCTSAWLVAAFQAYAWIRPGG